MICALLWLLLSRYSEFLQIAYRLFQSLHDGLEKVCFGCHLRFTSVAVNAGLTALSTVSKHVARVFETLAALGPVGTFVVSVRAVFGDCTAASGKAVVLAMIGREG